MNCQDFELNVIQLARDQLLDAGNREQCLAHTRGCLRCRKRLEEEHALIAEAHAVMAVLGTAEAPAHVEAALLVTFRAQARQRNALAVRSLSGQKRIRQWTFGAAQLVAAVAVIVVGLMWLRSGPAPSPELSTVSKHAQEMPVSKGGANVARQELLLVPAEAQQLKTRHRGRQPVRQKQEADDAATQFYSLVEAGELAPLESGRVVRVEVVASALIPFGGPLTPETLTQPMQADLLLGQDGLARAIRFLPASHNIKTQ